MLLNIRSGSNTQRSGVEISNNKEEIDTWRTEQQIKRKWIIMTEIRSQAKENKEKDDF